MDKNVCLLLLFVLEKVESFQDRLDFRATTVYNTSPMTQILCLLGPIVKKIEGGRTEDAPRRRFRKYSVGKTFIAQQLGSLHFWAFEGPRGALKHGTAPGLRTPCRDLATMQGRLFSGIRKVWDQHFRTQMRKNGGTFQGGGGVLLGPWRIWIDREQGECLGNNGIKDSTKQDWGLAAVWCGCGMGSGFQTFLIITHSKKYISGMTIYTRALYY